MDAQIQDFSRIVEKDLDLDGVVLPAGSRAIVLYGATNRDERKYPDQTVSMCFAGRSTTLISAPGRTLASG